MIRAIVAFLFLLIVASVAYALPFPRGSVVSGGAACVFTGATTDGSCITNAITTSLGPDSTGFAYGFDPANCDTNSPKNCNLNIYVGGVYSSVAGIGMEAIYKATPNLTYFDSNYVVCGTWWQWYDGSATELALSAGTPLGGTYFTNTTHGTHYNSAGLLFGNAVNNDAITISAAPHDCWPQYMAFNQTGMTITATGASFGGVSTSKGILVIGANDSGGGVNTTWNGGNFNGAVRIGTNATGVTIENATFHTACGSNPSGSATSCIEGGNGEGTVTLTNDTVYGGGLGGSGGQYHNAYLSANVAGDTAATAIISGLISYNVIGQGWMLKLRPEGETTQNHITQSVIGCTTAQTNVNTCDPNGTIDMPCGGDYKIDFSTIEKSTVNDTSGGGGYIMRYMEENRDGSAQCPVAYATTNNAILDHDIIIWDGPQASGWSVTNAICLALPDASGNCKSSAPSGGGALPTITCTITNSVLIGDSANSVSLTPGAGCLGSAGAAVCSDGTNRCYINRTAAAAGEGWTGNDQFGNPCCAYPYLPAHP